jgi:hypothetical protein
MSLRPTASYLLLELTFIVLARPLELMPSDAELTNEDIKSLPMIGDVNLFFKNPRADPEFEVECEVMIAGRCPTLILYHRSFLTSRQMHTHFSYRPQSPRTVVNGAHMQRSSCSCLTRATSSA